MTLIQEYIDIINRINSATQRIGLGNILAEIESNASGGDVSGSLDAFREELDGILELIGGLEDKVNALASEDKYSSLISVNSKSISDISSKLDKYISSQKKANQPKSRVIVPPPTEE